jgi:hypothetical protein
LWYPERKKPIGIPRWIILKWMLKENGWSRIYRIDVQMQTIKSKTERHSTGSELTRRKGVIQNTKLLCK